MEKLKITYVYDPLCGWCYGFSPVIKKFYKKFRSKLDFEVISGGMILGERVGPISVMAQYIKQAYKVVEQRTGVTFGQQFLKALDEGKIVISSLPPSRALTTFKTFRPDDAVLMAHEIQKAIYYEGHAPVDVNVYTRLAEKFELPVKAFQEKLLSEEIALATEDEFKKSAQLGVTGFPTVFLNKGDQMMQIAQGYLPYEDLLMNAINGAAAYDVELV